MKTIQVFNVPALREMLDKKYLREKILGEAHKDLCVRDFTFIKNNSEYFSKEQLIAAGV